MGVIFGRRRSGDGDFEKFLIKDQNAAEEEDDSISESFSEDSSWSEEAESDSLDDNCTDSVYILASKAPSAKSLVIGEEELQKGVRVEILYCGLGWMRGSIYRWFVGAQGWGIIFDNGKDDKVPFDPSIWRWAKSEDKDGNPIE